MNFISLNYGEGKMTYLLIQSITRRSPIICVNEETRRSIVRNGKILCSKLYPDDNTISIPTPVTYKEFDEGRFNKSLSYIFDSIEEYFKYKGINVRTLVSESEK